MFDVYKKLTFGVIFIKDKKDDRRVKYTKMVLKDSFIKLLTKKAISQITIKEICENADVNRATFYAHYSDQYDLMRNIENELFDNINSYIYNQTETGEEQKSYNSDWNKTVDMVEKIFDYIKENAELCKLLLNDRGDLKFQKRIIMLVYNKNIENITKQGKITKIDAEYIHSFGITGCVGCIQKWFDNDMDYSSRYMSEMLVRLFFSLVEGFQYKQK